MSWRDQSMAAPQHPVSDESRERYTLISAIETQRRSTVIAYFLSDRSGANAQIAEDAVRPIYDHLRTVAPVHKIDLFLHSVGGLTDVPWRIVTMIREFAEEFAVLIPYKALSAATMIALGADEIVMGRKGELSPIDPQLSIQRNGEGGIPKQEQLAVEDIMSYVRFLRDKVGLSDQSALAVPVSALATKLEPWILGQINRAHSHIRSVARKLLTSPGKQRTLDEPRIQAIVDMLAEKTYQHGHAIGRKEAKEIGLNVVEPSSPLEDLMWRLFESYEALCKIRQPVDPRSFVPAGKEEYAEHVVTGCIESVALAHRLEGELLGRTRRQIPPQLNFNLNFNLQFPANVQQHELPAALQQSIQQALQQLQQQAHALVQQELNRQMPIIGFEGWIQGAAWRRSDDWPDSVPVATGSMSGSAPFCQIEPATIEPAAVNGWTPRSGQSGAADESHNVSPAGHPRDPRVYLD